LAVAVLTALGERNGTVQDAERRAGEALRTMTDDEGLSVREAVEWCGNGLTLREITRLRRLDGGQQDGAREPRVGCGWPGRARRDAANDPDERFEADRWCGIGCCVV
jgi:hypothetical protein